MATYPQNLEIEIDRVNLLKYVRFQRFFLWLGFFGFFSFLFGLPVTLNQFEGKEAGGTGAIVSAFAKGFGITIVSGMVMAVMGYLIFSHRQARRYVESLQISVEGAFLRIREYGVGMTDRKIHFRSLVDYSCTQTRSMERFGIASLQMATTAGGQRTGIAIAGIKDCLKVRDMLAEIDSLRENG